MSNMPMSACLGFVTGCREVSVFSACIERLVPTRSALDVQKDPVGAGRIRKPEVSESIAVEVGGVHAIRSVGLLSDRDPNPCHPRTVIEVELVSTPNICHDHIDGSV